MEAITTRRASPEDAPAIHALFLEQFPFLEEVRERALKDVHFRIEDPSSVTVVAVSDRGVLAAARGYRQGDIYLMNSICAASRDNLLARTRAIARLMPFYVETCLSHARGLGLTRAFYGTDSRSLARLVGVLCSRKGLAIEEASHGGRRGFWIFEP